MAVSSVLSGEDEGFAGHWFVMVYFVEIAVFGVASVGSCLGNLVRMERCQKERVERSGCGADIKYTVPAGQRVDPVSVPGPQWVSTGWVPTYKSQGHFTMCLAFIPYFTFH